MTPFEQNLQRLLHDAYQPEVPDPAFVAELEQRLRSTAQERAAVQASERRVGRVRRWLGWAMTVAAVAAIAGLIVYARRPWPRTEAPPLQRVDPEAMTAWPQRLTPQPKGEAPKPATLGVGESLRTELGQRKRVKLPDGSVLFVNAETSLKVEGPRSVALERGEVYVEVAPRPDERFVIKTPDRQVTALGTRFTVRADEKKTSVAVTQGKVQVSGLKEVLYAGQQLAPDGEQASAAPRFSQLLEWTRDLMAEADSPLVPGTNYGSGQLIAYDPTGQAAKITLRRFHLDVHIEDGFARTTIDQTYFNEEHDRLEGTFFFPVPPDASISRLAMYVDGKLMEGGMAERDHARNTFEEIRYMRRDPALLEWLDGSTFKMRVFPLEARQEKRIVLSYTQRLARVNDQVSYRFPAGHDLRVVNEWSTQIRVVRGASVSWTSPTHKLESARDGADVLLRASARKGKLDRDLQVDLNDRGDVAPTRFSSAELDGQRYLMLRHNVVHPSPPALRGRGDGGEGDSPAEPKRNAIDSASQSPSPPSPLPRKAGGEGRQTSSHYVVLFESSADRDPLLARTQIEIVRTILDNLEHRDTFQILTAGTRTKLLAQEPWAATPENVTKALAALEQVHLVGALDLEAALDAAGQLLKGHEHSSLMHVGSGIPALGLRSEDELAKRLPEGVRYAGIGVGKRWGRALMRAAAERSGGHYTQINPDEQVSWRAFDFLSSLRLPRLQNITVADDRGRTWLLLEPSVGAGEELCAASRAEANDPLPREVIVRGLVDGKPFEEKLKVEHVAPNAGYIPRTWGKLEIDRLVAEGAAANKAKIIELSKAMYVMSPFTSLLVLENEAMYQQYKVDRGRKDHWAMYACPERIPVVHEPVSSPSAGEPVNVTSGRGPTADVLKSILLRNARYIWTPATTPGKPGTARDMMTGALVIGTPDQAVSNRLGEVDEAKRHVISEIETLRRQLRSGALRGDLTSVPLPELGGIVIGGGVDRREVQQIVDAIQGRRFIPSGFLNDPSPKQLIQGLTPAGTLTPDLDIPLKYSSFGNNVMFARPNAFGGGNGSNFIMPNYYNGTAFGGAQGFSGQFGLVGLGLGGGQGGLGGLGGGQGGLGGGFQGIGIGGGNFTQPQGFGFGGQFGLGAGQFGLAGTSTLPMNGAIPGGWYYAPNANLGQFGQPGFAGYMSWPQQHMLYWYEGTPLTDALTKRVSSTARGFQPRHMRGEPAPVFNPNLILQPANQNTVNWRMLFADLVAFAPGMETSAADIQATLEAEATEFAALKRGKIAEKARALIERSRKTRWRTNRIPGGTTVTYDGAGRFVIDHTLPTGLRETIVNDGTTLLHLYPEIGVGARRAMSRAYRAEFEAMLPGALPPAEDLAIGSDVVAVDEHTIAIVRLGTAEKKAEVRLTFGDDGRLVSKCLVLMPENKELQAERFDKIKTAEAPDLKPDTSKLVVLPLPYRTLAWSQARAANDDHRLLASHFAAAAHEMGHNADALHHFIGERRVKLGSLPGLITLLRAAGDMRVLNNINERLNWTLCLYIRNVVQEQRRPADVPAANGLVANLARLHDLWHLWSFSLASSIDAARQPHWRDVRDFAEHHRADGLGWLAVLTVGTDRGYTQEEWRTVAELWQLVETDPEHGYGAKYERIQCLTRGGLPNTARMAFDDLYRKTLAAGVVPPIDAQIKALPPAEDGSTWESLLVSAAGEMVRQGRPADALAVANQCHILGGLALARQAYAQIAPKFGEFPVGLRFATAVFLARVGDRAQAEELLRPLLKEKDLGDDPLAWRLAADLAGQGGSVARKVAYLEKALDLEFAQLPEAIDVQALRQDYDALLTGYADWLTACRMADAAAPTDLAPRVVKFADRWRSLDPDPTAACQKASRVLRQLGESELAWEYLTSPLAAGTNQAEPLKKLGDELQQSGELELATKALGAAYAAEPTNAELLWQQANVLLQAGKSSEAQLLLHKLADGTWQPRFETYKSQARALLTK